jgi:hypothetical protein
MDDVCHCAGFDYDDYAAGRIDADQNDVFVQPDPTKAPPCETCGLPVTVMIANAGFEEWCRKRAKAGT